jgi:rare lipoprotein A
LKKTVTIGLAALGAALCFGIAAEPTSAAEKRQEKHQVAAIYSATGGMTSSGEHYSPSKLTAAHRTLPFGTMVRVTNLHNGHSVVVRINDRGPFTKSFAIDLSQAAAKELRFSGIAPVTLEVMRPEPVVASSPAPAPSPTAVPLTSAPVTEVSNTRP